MKDVLYGLHGFAIQDPCSSLRETGRGNTFSHAAQTRCPSTQKEVQNPAKGIPKLLSEAFGSIQKRSPKPGTTKSDVLSPVAPRGIYCFRAPGPENGTLVIYLYITGTSFPGPQVANTGPPAGFPEAKMLFFGFLVPIVLHLDSCTQIWSDLEASGDIGRSQK